ncbi:dihydrofolate reductase [Erythrobacter sp. W53]|uniref:dihydrofolate reductase n=1 Tax=Erythrobacter sp. W53 TaxID=3425947 RepID=UPI003D768897
MSTGDPRIELTSIVAIDENGAIGCQNSLPWRLKSDLAFFRKTTTNNTVIMGRKTYDSIGKCLPNRQNLVLSHNNVLFSSTKNCRLVTSVDEALHLSSTNKKRKRFVIGGAQTYELFAPFVDRYLVTVVQHKVADADAYLADTILQLFGEWEKRSVTRFDAAADQNDFDCEVYEYLAPDAEERAALRAEISNSYAERSSSRSNSKKTRPRSMLEPANQTSFAFAAS